MLHGQKQQQRLQLQWPLHQDCYRPRELKHQQKQGGGLLERLLLQPKPPLPPLQQRLLPRQVWKGSTGLKVGKAQRQPVQRP